jgi:ATP-binding cassette, subfamily B, bacterial
VRAAALAAGLANTLARLAEGLDAEIGERGVGLSVGERQCLQIARALVAQPRVMILDEATANLDYATETDIRRAVFAAQPHPTTLVIAHRYSMVEHADHVIVMEAGRIRDQGTVADLKQRDDWFAGFAASAAATPVASQLPALTASHRVDDGEHPDE